jgi:hypothetical protein
MVEDLDSTQHYQFPPILLKGYWFAVLDLFMFHASGFQ